VGMWYLLTGDRSCLLLVLPTTLHPSLMPSLCTDTAYLNRFPVLAASALIVIFFRCLIRSIRGSSQSASCSRRSPLLNNCFSADGLSCPSSSSTCARSCPRRCINSSSSSRACCCCWACPVLSRAGGGGRAKCTCCFLALALGTCFIFPPPALV
jgi:hypothetical protein